MFPHFLTWYFSAHPAAIVHLLERLAYYGVKGSAAVLAKSAGIVQHYIQNVNRKLEFAVPIFFAKDHFMVSTLYVYVI